MKFSWLITMLLCAIMLAAKAEPVVPKSDSLVLETLPARPFRSPLVSPKMPLASASDKSGAASTRRDPAAAAKIARQHLAIARDRGDQRFAGYALAALRPWQGDLSAPAPIVVLLATLAQYQHNFDAARQMLHSLVERDGAQPQAWLTLATIERVQGRYADSDRACRKLATMALRLYTDACLAENAALRGELGAARQQLQALLAANPGSAAIAAPEQADTRRWLLTTSAELEERAGRVSIADFRYREALKAGRDSYLVLGYADFLLDHGRAHEALMLLDQEPQPHGDGVLLRKAIAQRSLGMPEAADSAREMGDRFAAALERSDPISVHGRELSRFALTIEGQPKKALAIARDNLKIQKEPADLLLMAKAAQAAGDGAALREVQALARSMGLYDVRLAKVLGHSL